MRKNIETMNKKHLQEFEKKRKQRSNVNRDVVVKSLMIHLIDDLIIHHNIVLYQNQQSSFIQRFIKIHKSFDDL